MEICFLATTTTILFPTTGTAKACPTPPTQMEQQIKSLRRAFDLPSKQVINTIREIDSNVIEVSQENIAVTDEEIHESIIMTNELYEERIDKRMQNHGSRLQAQLEDLGFHLVKNKAGVLPNILEFGRWLTPANPLRRLISFPDGIFSAFNKAQEKYGEVSLDDTLFIQLVKAIKLNSVYQRDSHLIFVTPKQNVHFDSFISSFTPRLTLKLAKRMMAFSNLEFSYSSIELMQDGKLWVGLTNHGIESHTLLEWKARLEELFTEEILDLKGVLNNHQIAAFRYWLTLNNKFEFVSYR